ncbi:MAG TPA: peptidylprolyl isomerase [Thermoleophilia bacterium]|jgi:FKBP-type peptidyl-prolyl cis-trans isomerase SlyD
MKATRGAVVSLGYTLKDDEGTILDTNEECEPLTYLHGFDNIIPGLERGLEGAGVGFKDAIVVEPLDAYGEVDPEAIFSVSRSDFPEEMIVTEGMQVVGDTPNGPVSLVVVEVADDEVVVDANHPLAGMRLHFDVEVLDLRAATDAELNAGHPQ